MANPAKRKVPASSRTTPKGGPARVDKSTQPTKAAPGATSRYTPPVPSEYKVSPRWVPVVMFTLLGAGMAMIFCNYLGLVPGGTSNWYLLGGLGLILLGIITATQYR